MFISLLELSIYLCLYTMIINQPIMDSYTVSVHSNPGIDVKSPPENTIGLEKSGIPNVYTAVYHSRPHILRFVWLPRWVCEGGSEKPP